jgi:hypothetical protein
LKVADLVCISDGSVKTLEEAVTHHGLDDKSGMAFLLTLTDKPLQDPRYSHP